jgi:hypothetical protein
MAMKTVVPGWATMVMALDQRRLRLRIEQRWSRAQWLRHCFRHRQCGYGIGGLSNDGYGIYVYIHEVTF